MPLPKQGILEEQIEKIKTLLWEGTLSQREIASECGVSQGTVSNILRGHIGRNIRWPDDSLGHMPVDRYKYLCWTHNVKPGKRTVKYSQENKLSPEIEKAATLIEQIELRRAAGENIDDIIDEDGVIIEKKSETPPSNPEVVD